MRYANAICYTYRLNTPLDHVNEVEAEPGKSLRGNELLNQQEDVYYSEVDLPPLPPRNTTLKRNTESDSQYWTITDAEESQTKPSILHSANDTDCYPRATCHEANNYYNHAVKEQNSCITVTSGGHNANTVSHSDVESYIANISGDSNGGETTTAIPLANIHAAHCSSVAIAPDILENSKSQSTTRATAITMSLRRNQAHGTDTAQRVSSESDNEITTNGADIAIAPAEDVETDTNIAYSCNDDTIAVTDNPAYSTDIAIAPDVSTQDNVAYNITITERM